MKRLFLALALASASCFAIAQTNISPEMLKSMRENNKLTAAEKALHTAMTNVDINDLALNSQGVAKNTDVKFSHQVKSSGITNQESSGRCWLFTGLNVMRAQAMDELGLPTTFFSPLYVFFYDQLEKSNLFLQSIIDTRKLPLNDRKVEWLLKNPLSDGGTYTGVADLVEKYGIVPQEVMPENKVSNNTSRMNQILSLKLREFALELRNMPAKTSEAVLAKRKAEMMGTVYHILALTLGEPVQQFEWSRKDKDGNILETKTYTPQEFYKELIGEKLYDNYVLLMNDPSREYYKVYEIEYDRHMYDGHNWLYVNLPIEDIKEAAIASIKDNKAMYISCDVGKFYTRNSSYLDVNNFDYESLFGTTFGMDKKQRIETFASGSSHAMTLVAVDLNAAGKPVKWMVENSWGADRGYKGHLIMTDEWFNEYMFRVVVNKKYASEKILNCLKQKSILLPAWDPMFAEDKD
ncbi:MAG: C1 family peptidase [Paludibacteraceae bacterium]|nr:C1 family peptidase [Paludibacteraceae bacterium]